MTDPSSTGPGDLSFDRAIPATPAAGEAGSGVPCGNCGRVLTETYHTVNGEAICASCRGKLEMATRGVTEPTLIARALLFGFGAAIVGAIIYWAVMRFANLEIGLVAILTGWMVGKAVRAGAQGRGGRALQVAGALLVYLSVAMAYFPFVIEGAMESAKEEAAALPADTTGAVTADLAQDTIKPAGAASQETRVTEESVGGAGAFIALGVFALLLPLRVILADLPGGLISALIIGFGMLQAWQMSGRPKVTFEGPFRVGGAPAA